MKKHVLYFIPFCLLTFIACSRDRHKVPEKKKDLLIEAYKNTLQVPVDMQFGYLKSKDSSKKDIEYSPKITIAAGKTYEQQPQTSPVVVPAMVSVKFKFGEKEKVDTLCDPFFPEDTVGHARCKKDTISFFNKARWKDIKSNKGNVTIIRQEYTIDAKDMAEAK